MRTMFLQIHFSEMCSKQKHFTRPAEREQSQCVKNRPKKNTGRLVRDSKAPRVSSIFLWVIWKLEIRFFLFFGDFLPARLIFSTIDQV